VVFVLVSSTAVAVVPLALLPEQNATEEDSWTHYQSIVIFRNDDIQPHYRADTMRAVDQVFIEEDVPVTAGVIPAIGGEQLDPNGELCQYLRSQKQTHPQTFEYALHGYTHQQRTTFSGGSEFGGVPPERQQELIQDGTQVLQACLDETPTTFIPPLDTYDNATATALSAEAYEVVSGGGWFTNEYYNETGPFESNEILHLPSSQSFVKNWSTNEFHTRTYLEQQFDAAYRDGDVYMQVLHYPTFTSESKREVLRGLIGYMKSKDDVAFMTVGEFARKYKNGQLERTETGWRVMETTGDSTASPVRHDIEIGNHVREQTAMHWMPEVHADE